VLKNEFENDLIEFGKLIENNSKTFTQNYQIYLPGVVGKGAGGSPNYYGGGGYDKIPAGQGGTHRTSYH
jgi:hypothetical protein